MINIIQLIKIVVLSIVLSLGLSYVYAWTAPTGTPPAGNADAPINTSGSDQTKTGILRVTDLVTNRITFTDGTSVTTAPTPHGKQLFTSNGTLTVPEGVTRVYLTGSGSGGTGGSGATVGAWGGSGLGGVGATGYGTGSTGVKGTGCDAFLGGRGGTGPGYSSGTGGGGGIGAAGGGGGGLGQSAYNQEVAVISGQSYSITLGAGLPTNFGSVFSLAKGGNGGNGVGSTGGAAGVNGTQRLPIFGSSGGGGGGGGCLAGGAGGLGAPGYLLVEW